MFVLRREDEQITQKRVMDIPTYACKWQEENNYLVNEVSFSS